MNPDSVQAIVSMLSTAFSTTAQVEGASAGEAPFLVMNPAYHNGARASFLLLSRVFDDHLLQQLGTETSEVLPTTGGRMIAVTDKAMVFTIVHRAKGGKLRIDNVKFMAESRKALDRELGVYAVRLYDAAKDERWIVKLEDMEEAIRQARDAMRAASADQYIEIDWKQAVEHRGKRPQMMTKGGTS